MAAGRVFSTNGAVTGFGMTGTRNSEGNYTLTLDTPSAGLTNTIVAMVGPTAIKTIGAIPTSVQTFDVKTRDWNGSGWDPEDNSFYVVVFDT